MRASSKPIVLGAVVLVLGCSNHGQPTGVQATDGQAPSCTDGVKDGSETDKDCGGGSCPPCGPGMACGADTDCDTGTCTNNVCGAPACTACTGDGYPNTYTIPTDREYAICDTPETINNLYALGATSTYEQQLRGAMVESGHYLADKNAPVKWKNKGGDWFDMTGAAQGTAPFASAPVTDTNSENWVTWDVSTLVSGWLSGTWRNAGVTLRGDNANVIRWRSRFAATNTPELVLTTVSHGMVTIPCGRSIWISTSGMTTQAGNPEFQTSGTSSSAILWFDLTGYKANDVSSATLRASTFAQFGPQMVHVFRTSNPGDQTTIGQQQLGIAANYPLDVGIENDPDTLFVQKFADDSWDDLWMRGSNGSGPTRVTAADTNGFSPLAGQFAAIKCQNVAGGDNSALEAHWSPWRGYGQRLKPYQEVEELYLRYYLLWGNDWDPSPNGGKMPGFDGRYADISPGSGVPTPSLTLPGMSRGNSGSGTDGFTGWSARCNYNRYATPGSPTENLRSLGSGDMYVVDQTGAYGIDGGWGNNYLAQLRKATWNSIELYLKLNTVTDPTQVPHHIASITQSAGLATVTLADPIVNDPKYVTGQSWTIGGVGLYAGYQQNQYQGPKVITVVDATHFTFACDPATPSPAVPGTGPTQAVWMLCAPSQGNYDGVVRGWVNGRLAGEITNLRFRHTRLRPDGGILGIDNAWFAVFQGGGPKPDHTFSCYLSDMIVAKKYIGPMTGYHP